MEEIINAIAQIDFCYFAINKLVNEIEEENKTKSPIKRLVDNATNYNKAKTIEQYNEVLNLVECIIENKLKIGYSVLNDTSFWCELNNNLTKVTS